MLSSLLAGPRDRTASGRRSFELRATIGLARLWQQQGKTREAHNLLAPLLEAFSEGLGTRDLKVASQLLREMTTQK